MSTSTLSEVTSFLVSYEEVTNSHDFNNVRPLLDQDMVYRFSDGSYNSIEDLEQAFVRTRNTIQDEVYWLKDIKRIVLEENIAVCLYTFIWKWMIDWSFSEWSWRWTNVLRKRNGKWYMLHEHLSVPEEKN